MSAQTTIITTSGTRYEVCEDTLNVRRLAPVSGPDGLFYCWPDGETKAVLSVAIGNRYGFPLPVLSIVTDDGGVITTSGIVSLTDGILGA